MATGQAFGEGNRYGEDSLFADQQLALTEDDERLPWLETGDFDEDDAPWDNGRMLGFAFLAVPLLMLAAFAAWWFMLRDAGGGLQPEGTTIAAPATPYKIRPSDPGGKVFEGTGDTSFAVGEGQTREGRLAAKPATIPSAATSPVPSVSASPPESAPQSPPGDGAAVQVGAYASRSAAEAGWQTLLRRTDKLAGVSHRVVEGQADIGTVYRLQVPQGDVAGAKQLCAALKGDGVACTVKR